MATKTSKKSKPTTSEHEPNKPRPFWSGVVTFGLVNLPVSLFSAYRGKPYRLKMVDKDGTPLNRRYYCEAEGKALNNDDIVRGFEVEDGKFIELDERELEAAAPKKSQEIELQRFVKLEELDPVYFSHAYFLVPDQRTTKAYRLLAQSMEEDQRAGIATFVMRNREYLVAIIAEHGILRAEVLRFQDEIRTPEQVGLPELAKVKKPDVSAMTKAMNSLKVKTVKPAQWTDDYHAKLQTLVKSKLKKRQDVVKAPEVVEEEYEDNVIDLMQILKSRLQGKSDSARTSTRTTAHAAKKGSTKRKTSTATAKKHK